MGFKGAINNVNKREFSFIVKQIPSGVFPSRLICLLCRETFKYSPKSDCKLMSRSALFKSRVPKTKQNSWVNHKEKPHVFLNLGWFVCFMNRAIENESSRTLATC